MRECLGTFRAFAGLELVPVLVPPVLLVLPLHLEHLVALLAGEAPGQGKTDDGWHLPLHMELLVLVELCHRSKCLVTYWTKKLHSGG